MVECNKLSSLMWSLREEGMSSRLWWSGWYPGKACVSAPCSLSHPPASRDACLGFPWDPAVSSPLLGSPV